MHFIYLQFWQDSFYLLSVNVSACNHMIYPDHLYNPVSTRDKPPRYLLHHWDILRTLSCTTQFNIKIVCNLCDDVIDWSDTVKHLNL